jgi:hypothetical protein
MEDNLLGFVVFLAVQRSNAAARVVQILEV